MTQMGLVREIVDSIVIVKEADPRIESGALMSLFDDEREAIQGAVLKRRREFVTGRLLARAAMAELGCPPRAVPVGKDRAPVWPAGLIGSISHTETWCVVALANTQTVSAIGVDVEGDSSMPESMVPIICTKEEELWLQGVSPSRRNFYVKLIFSAKESVYKALHPLTGMFLDFHDLSVALGPVPGKWRVIIKSNHYLQMLPYDVIEGNWLQRDGLLATAVVLYSALSRQTSRES